MDKSELYKYLSLQVKDIPTHVMEILDEYGMDLIYDFHPGLEDEFNKLLAARKTEFFPNEGLELIRNFFTDFSNELDKIKLDISITRKIEKLNQIKRVFLKMLNPLPNDILELEVRRHRSYLNDYINIVEDELKRLNEQIRTNNEVPRLQTNLTTNQRGQLFTELVNGGFIPDENPDCFNWAFAAKGETEPTQPGQWQPIKWEKSKWLLAYFVDLFNCEFLGNDGIKKRTQWKPFELLFGETGLRGSKNDYQKTGSLPDGYKQIEVIIKSLK